MLNNITVEALEFLEEAKKAFESNYKMITYRNKNDEFIALRNGFNETIIDVYEISQPVGRFTDQLPSQYTETVLTDELDKLKETAKSVEKLKRVLDYNYEKYKDNEIVRELFTNMYAQMSINK